MPEFLRVLTLEQAKTKLEENWRPRPHVVTLPLDGVLGRVLAEDVVSKIDVPSFDRAAYDGFAVSASDTFGAGEGSPVRLVLAGRLMAGAWPKKRLRKGECAEISTGAPMPEGSDSVVMSEDTVAKGEKVEVYRAVTPGENVVKRGSDIRRGQRVLHAGEPLTHVKLGVLAAIGIGRVRVFSRPKVAIVSSGAELVRPGGRLSLGKVYDINGPALSGAVSSCGAEPVYLGIARDRAPDIRKLVRKGLSPCDVVLISGGSSAGVGDIIPRVVSGMGRPGVIVHGLALKPGKPTFIAVLNGKPVFGLPGYPVSALMVFDQLVADYLCELSGEPRPQRPTVQAKLTTRVLSARGRRELVPVRLVKKNGESLAEPILKGSGAVTSISTAEGYIEVPLERELVEEGEVVKVRLFGGERRDQG
jgi:molybdenum cofactor synthesis domain-containing protein